MQGCELARSTSSFRGFRSYDPSPMDLYGFSTAILRCPNEAYSSRQCLVRRSPEESRGFVVFWIACQVRYSWASLTHVLPGILVSLSHAALEHRVIVSLWHNLRPWPSRMSSVHLSLGLRHDRRLNSNLSRSATTVLQWTKLRLLDQSSNCVTSATLS